MPPNAPSPTHSRTDDDNDPKPMSEAALRKKKNADAQAAFRARRANYIATLEETVTNLEGVVLHLQDACRETKNEVAELRAENNRLKIEGKERERFWKDLVANKNSLKSSQSPEVHSDFPSYGSVAQPSGAVASAVGSAMGHYPDDAMRYPPNGDSSSSLAGATYHTGSEQNYPQRSPALSYAGVESDSNSEGRIHHMNGHRVQRYGSYSATWNQQAAHVAPSPSEPGTIDSGSSSHSPAFLESPILTASDMAYATRYPIAEDQKLPMTPIDTPYMFPASRSLSPAISTPTSTSSTSASLSSTPYPFTFPEGTVVQDRPEFQGFRRHSINHGAPELTLHGGTADISVASTGLDAVRYRLGHRATNNGADRAALISSFTRQDSVMNGNESDDGDSSSYGYSAHPRHHRHRTTMSRSPSPGTPQICGTLAVIKAQAFGALRRTRTRTKKSSEGAAKAAVEALEARGIGMGVGSATKRQRLHDDDGGDMRI